MISLILWAIAPILNAIMDLVENENFSQSIFSKLNPKFWYKRESWLAAPHIGKYHIDAWHLAKSIMILCWAGSLAMIYFEGLPITWFSYKILNALTDVAVRGILWNVLFSLFYHKLFRSKTWATKLISKS